LRILTLTLIRRQADAATDGEEAQRAKEEAAAATESLRLKLEAAQREAADGAAAKAAAAQVVAELKAAEWRYEQELQAVRATAAAEAEAALRTHAVQHAALSEEIKSVKSELKLALVQVSVVMPTCVSSWGVFGCNKSVELSSGLVQRGQLSHFACRHTVETPGDFDVTASVEWAVLNRACNRLLGLRAV
jgi:hypothetical protein